MLGKFEIPVLVEDEEFLPRRAHIDDVGYDLRAKLPSPVTLGIGEQQLIPTGVKIALPCDIEKGICVAGIIKDRSGLAAKKGLHVLAGVVDPGYRGEVKVVLKNLGNEPITIERGMRIAQLLFVPVIIPTLKVVNELPDTLRGEKGFGSTGTK
jgi:dUTP pyrophosphatase